MRALKLDNSSNWFVSAMDYLDNVSIDEAK